MNSIGALLSHIYSCEHLFRIQFIEQRELTAEENEKWIPGCTLGKYVPQLITNQPIDFYITELLNSRTSLLEKVNGLDKIKFHKKHEGYNINTGYNLAWLLYHLAEDEVHHRGQISILRKLYSQKSAKFRS